MKPIITIEYMISQLGEIPFCSCGCNENVHIKIDRVSFNRYKRDGYPQYILGHQLLGIKRPKQSEFMKLHNPMFVPEVAAKLTGEGNGMYGVHRFGSNAPSFGIPCSSEKANKIRDSETGKIVTYSTRLKQSISQREYRRLHPESKLRDSERQKCKVGKDAPCWKGGITPLHRQIRQCDEYSEWRIQVFTRDNYTCQECGCYGGWLEAHHNHRFTDILKQYNITSLEQAINCQELWDINNGKTLCEECHQDITWER